MLQEIDQTAHGIEDHYLIYRTKKTASLIDNEIVTVTHPFLPNSGKQYILIGRLKPQGKENLICQDLDGNETIIPIEYTNFKKQNIFQEQANGRCDFQYDDLQKLAELIKKCAKLSNEIRRIV
jgi:hypothetical protein